MPALLELASLVNGEVIGDGNLQITGVAGLEDAVAGDITFVVSDRVVHKALGSQASALIIPANVNEVTKPAIKVVNPRLAFAQILNWFFPPAACRPGIHATAVVGSDFQDGGCSIGALAVIGNQVAVGKNTVIYPGVVLGDRVTIGSNSIIHANVVIRDDCSIGDNVQIHAGTVVGSDGFGYVTLNNGENIKIPQVGRVVVEADVEIGANVTIDRATTGVTLIKRGAKIDNLVQIGHNCEIGKDNILCGQSGLAGSTILGDRVTLAGRAGVIGHVKIGDDSVVAACSLAINSLPAHSFVSGTPARTHGSDMRNQAAIGRLPELLKEFKELQKKVNELEKRISSEKQPN